MIYYLVTDEHAYTMQWYLDSGWCPALVERLGIVRYEHIWEMARMPAGTYIFSDLERLTPAELDICARLASRLAAAGCPVLNVPGRVLPRYSLLRELHRRDPKQFQTYRASEMGRPDEFPVFLRPEAEHYAASSLIESRDELDIRLEQTLRDHGTLDDLLIVEFCDTSDDEGVFRKYGIHLVGDRIVSSEVQFSREWMVKVPDLLEPRYIAEELEYMYAKPHEGWARAMFSIAGVQYGRIDYSLWNGRPQLWEINTNPTILVAREEMPESQMPGREMFAAKFEEALLELDSAFCGGYSIDTGLRLHVHDFG